MPPPQENVTITKGQRWVTYTIYYTAAEQIAFLGIDEEKKSSHCFVTFSLFCGQGYNWFLDQLIYEWVDVQRIIGHMLVLLVIKTICKYLITYSASWTKTSSVNIAHLILLLNLNSKKKINQENNENECSFTIINLFLLKLFIGIIMNGFLNFLL